MNPAVDSLQSELDEHQRFEALLVDLSARFVSVPADQVDNEIEDAQRRICECLQLDAALLWQWTSRPPLGLHLTHMYRPLAGWPPPGPDEVRLVYPWLYAQLLAGNMYVNASLDDLPPEAARDKATLQRYGIKSNVGLPLVVGGRPLVGAMTFNTTRAPRAWTEAVVKRLQLVGQIFANALARKQAEADAQLLLRELAHLNRVATMSELATSLAHELNQPLGAILRNAEAAELMLQHDQPDLEELRAIVADIKRDDQRAGGVIDRLRSLLRRRSIVLQPAELPVLVDEVVAIAFADAGGRGIRIVNEVPAGIAAVRCDRILVQQVLLNLIVNGVDAIGTAGGAARVMIRAQAAGAGQVEVSVHDTGPGIAADALSSVFDPFFSTKPDGMGLGLAISRTLVEAHGGRLWADPGGAGGSGASFHFTLPAAAVAEDGA